MLALLRSTFANFYSSISNSDIFSVYQRIYLVVTRDMATKLWFYPLPISNLKRKHHHEVTLPKGIQENIQFGGLGTGGWGLGTGKSEEVINFRLPTSDFRPHF